MLPQLQRIRVVASRPRIGIPVPTSHALEYNRRSWPQYAAAITGAGGNPLELRLDQPLGQLREQLDRCAGFVLPGSPADVDPARFGEERDPATADPDPARVICDEAALEHAVQTGKPVLGICFGMQSMNVWRGGSLVQDLLPMPVNHGAGGSVAVAHSAVVVGASLLGNLLTSSEAPQEGQFRRLPVNSSHHQAVSIAGKGLTVVARGAEDGVVEAVEGLIGASTMIGVQWHPERSADISAASRALFLWLVLAAADVADGATELTDARAL